MNGSILRLIVSGAGVFLVLTSPAVIDRAKAQQQAQAQLSVEEIVVTSRKREENILEIPLSVQAFSVEKLESAGLRDLQDISSFTTSLTFENQSSWQPGRYNSIIRFRGMAAPIENPSFQSGTLFIDNVPMLSSAQAIPIADIERVEVIKGPQPVYFGRGTFGGAINYITADPSDEFGGRFVAEYAPEHDSYNFIGTVEGPVVEGRLLARLTGSLDKKGSMFTATDGGKLGRERTDGINATLLFTPSDALEIKVRASFNRIDDGPADSTFIAFVTEGNCGGQPITVQTTTGSFNTAIFNAGWYCGALPDVPVTNNTDLDNHGLLREVVINDLLNTFDEIGDIPKPDDFGLRTNIQNYSSQVDWEASDALTISALGGYNENRTGTIRDNDNTDLVFWANLGYQRYWAWTAEARALYDDGGPIRGLLGVSKYEQKVFGDIDSGPGVFFVFPPGRGQQIERDRIKTTGIFGSVDYDFNDWLTLSAEGRYQIDKVRNDGGALGGPKTTGPVITYKKFLPRVILTAQPQDGMTLYASFSKGALPGLRQAFFDGRTPEQIAEVEAQVGQITDQLPQEVVSNYELGWKQSWGNGFVSVSGYFMDWKAMKAGTLVLFTSEIDGRPLIGSVFVPGDSEIKGIEFEGGWTPVEQLNLGAVVGFNEAKYTDFLAGGFNAPFSLPSTGSGVSYKADGNQLPRTPKWKGTLSATWMDEFMTDWDWYLRGDFIYTDKTFMSEPNLAYVESYSLVNLRLGVIRNDNLNIELFCTNCFDEEGWRTAAKLPDLINLFRGFPGSQGAVVVPLDKTEVGLRLTYDF